MTFPFLATALGLAEFAPSLVRWLSGRKAEPIAEEVVRLAQKITGANSGAEVLAQLKANPKFAAQFQRDIVLKEAEWELALLEDRQLARERDLELWKTGHANRRADLMVFSAAGGLLMCLLSLAFYSDVLPGEAVGIISTVAGIFGGCLKDAFAFEFGSSRGSKAKDSTVAAILERLRQEG